MTDELILHREIREPVLSLGNEECGELFKALLNYKWDKAEQIQLLKGADIAFMFIRAQMDKDSEKIEKQNHARRENGKKGGRPRKTQIAQE